MLETLRILMMMVGRPEAVGFPATVAEVVGSVVQSCQREDSDSQEDLALGHAARGSVHLAWDQRDGRCDLVAVDTLLHGPIAWQDDPASGCWTLLALDQSVVIPGLR